MIDYFCKLCIIYMYSLYSKLYMIGEVFWKLDIISLEPDRPHIPYFQDTFVKSLHAEKS